MENDFLTLSQAAKCFPRPPSTTTLWRWCARGVKGGIRLRTTSIGGRVYIDRAAIQEFIQRCTEASHIAPPSIPKGNRSVRSVAEREAAMKRAEAILDS